MPPPSPTVHTRGLDGSKTYKVHLPPNIPAKDNWSFTLYDNQTRSNLQTDQRFPSVNSFDKGLVTNPDGSTDIWFGTEVASGSTRSELGADDPWKGLEHAFPPLRTAPTMVRQNVRVGEVELVK